MTESQLFEKVGRLQVSLDSVSAEYDRLLGLLAQVVAGDVTRSRLLVDLTNRSWELAAEGQRPASRCTINGLPVLVMAPPDPPPPDPPTDLAGAIAALRRAREPEAPA